MAGVGTINADLQLQASIAIMKKTMEQQAESLQVVDKMLHQLQALEPPAGSPPTQVLLGNIVDLYA